MPVPPVPPVPPVAFPVPAPPVAGPLGVVVTGAAGVADPDVPDVPDADDDAVELVVEVVFVVLVWVVLLLEAGVAVDVGTVNGGTSDVSAVVEPLPQATKPTDSAAPLRRAMANFRMLVGRTIRKGGDPCACRKPGSR
ncbi:MAG: hypothetical protein ACXVHQ_11260 [Solirubrobacteraceae bacterium]